MAVPADHAPEPALFGHRAKLEGRLMTGAEDPKAGAAGSVMNILDDPALNHRPQVQSGLLAKECGDLLRDFFAARRG